MDHKLKIVEIFIVGFAMASLFGYITQRIKLPSIVGYLIAGYLIGPFSPGFAVDLQVSEELAEIGVILMLFGVGLHFHLEDLYNVKNIAIPGALIQTGAAATVATLLYYLLGWSVSSGVIIGLALGVASTVVLVWVLTSYRILDTPEGHIAVGWLVVEDILTVAFLLMLPMFATFIESGNVSVMQLTGSIIFMLAKFLLLVLLIFTWGQQAVAFLLTNVARLRSHELFTVTLLALVFLIAFGSFYLFGTSIALGSFLAGMVIGKTQVRHQAAANSLPLKDIFAVVFFLTVGMLFNPQAIASHFGLFMGTMGVILIVKPLAAFLIVMLFGYSLKVALTVAFALSQIGEFSFILAEQATNLKLLPDLGYDILVACALLSIGINPLLFRLIDRIDRAVKKKEKISVRRFGMFPPLKRPPRKNIIIVGLSPIGKEVVDHLNKWNFPPVIIEQNIDLVDAHEHQGQIIYGDASQVNILESAHLDAAGLLVITTSDPAKALNIIHAARQINPSIRILTYLKEGTEPNWGEYEHIDCVFAERETSHALLRSISHLIHQYKI